MILDPSVCGDVDKVVRAEDFSGVSNKILFKHLIAMHDAGIKIDVILLAEWLKTSGELKNAGGVGYIGKVVQSVPNAAHARYYASIVRDKAILRGVIDASLATLVDAYDEQKTPLQLVDSAMKRLTNLWDSHEA